MKKILFIFIFLLSISDVYSQTEHEYRNKESEEYFKNNESIISDYNFEQTVKDAPDFNYKKAIEITDKNIKKHDLEKNKKKKYNGKK